MFDHIPFPSKIDYRKNSIRMSSMESKLTSGTRTDWKVRGGE